MADAQLHIFRHVNLDFTLTAAHDGDHRRTGCRYLACLAGDGCYNAVGITRQLRVAQLVAAGVGVGLCLAQRSISCLQLGVVLVARCFAHSTAGIQLVKACRIVGRQLLVGNGGCQLRIGCFYALVYILRINRHKNLAGVYPVAYVDKTGSDSAGSLEGQLAFVASAHLTGINGRGIGNAFADRHSPDDGDVVCLLRLMHNTAVKLPACGCQYNNGSSGNKFLFIRKFFHNRLHNLTAPLQKNFIVVKFLIVQLNYRF